jgi:hypothetical protein
VQTDLLAVFIQPPFERTHFILLAVRLQRRGNAGQFVIGHLRFYFSQELPEIARQLVAFRTKVGQLRVLNSHDLARHICRKFFQIPDDSIEVDIVFRRSGS